MRLYPPRIEISEEEGFGKHDLFQHKLFGENLMRLLQRIEHPLVVALNGDWGSGKTTFVRMWEGHVRSELAVIYFDAFANDYQEDAFLALAGKVLYFASEEIKEGDHQAVQALEKYKDKAADVGGSLVRAGLKIGVNAITLGLVNADEQVDHMERVISSELGNAVDRCVAERLDRQEEESEVFDKFREALSSLSSQLKSDRPLVVIIDELDRCRPSFALDLLEKVKHFFSVEGVHFILVTNLEQLQNSVRARYGSNIDARTYLEKFIDLTAYLPQTADSNHHVIDVFLQRMIDQLSFDDYHRHLRDQIFIQLQWISREVPMTFRKIERIHTLLVLCLMHGKQICEEYIPLTVGLCVIRQESDVLYNKAKSGTLSMDEVTEFFHLTDRNADNERVKCIAQDHWSMVLSAKLPEHLINRIGPNNRRWVISEICKSMDDFRLL